MDEPETWWRKIHLEKSDKDPRIVNVVFESYPAPQPVTPMSLEEATTYLVAAVDGGDLDDAKRALEAMGYDVAANRRILEAAANCTRPPPGLGQIVHDAWVERGFRLREALQDDELLVQAFRRLLPPYNGPRLTLYRGERGCEIEASRIGLNWTPDIKIARMFARGLCATYEGGGVLLTTNAPPEAITAGPSRHSTSLREAEHILDPKMLEGIVELERFPLMTGPATSA